MGDFATIPIAGPNGTRCWDFYPLRERQQGKGKCNLTNLSLQNTVYVSDNESVQPNSSQSAPLPPLTSRDFDGSSHVFVQCLPGQSATIARFPGSGGIREITPSTPSPDVYSPLSIILNKQFAGGVTEVQQFRVNVAGIESVIGTIFSQSQSGFGTAPFYRLRFAWSWASDNFDPIITDDIVLPSGPLSFTSNWRHDFSAPVYGDTLTVSYTNYDTQPQNVTFGFFGSVRGHPFSVRSRIPDSLANEAAGLATDNILLSLVQAPILAGAKGPAVVIPLYPGDVQVAGFLAGENPQGSALITIQPQPSTILGVPILLRSSALVGTNGILSGTPTYKSPRRVCTVQVDNTAGTATVTPNLIFIGTDSQ